MQCHTPIHYIHLAQYTFQQTTNYTHFINNIYRNLLYNTCITCITNKGYSIKNNFSTLPYGIQIYRL